MRKIDGASPRSGQNAHWQQEEGWMAHGPKTRVLVVDDEPSICKALSIVLGGAGYDVETVVSGDTATSLLRTEHFDVMIVDLRVPDMRGDILFALAAAIQPQLRTATLFITGDITARAEQLIAACGCPMLRKPFDLADVLDAVAALAPRRQVISA
jgi:DNA-binding NtrC family response regulator